MTFTVPRRMTVRTDTRCSRVYIKLVDIFSRCSIYPYIRGRNGQELKPVNMGLIFNEVAVLRISVYLFWVSNTLPLVRFLN